MIERKSRDICEKCENFCRSITRDGFPIYCCAIEHNPQRCGDGRIWHKLSTVLYTGLFEDCPYCRKRKQGWNRYAGMPWEANSWMNQT